MRDRVLLGLAVMLLFVGLTVWTVTSRDVDIDEERRAYLQAMRDPPPLGTDLHPADPRGTAAADACARAGLGDAPLRILFERDHRAVIGVGVAAREAMRVWTALHDVAPHTHLSPVILGDGFALARHADAAAHTSTSVESVLRRASALDLDAWLATRPAPTPGTAMPVAPRAEVWQSVLDPVLRAPVFDIAIALLPTEHASDAPAWLAFGNWPDCPEPAVHVAILQQLETLADAELVAITADRVELRVLAPPSTFADRNRLAELVARWDPSAFREDRATIASWSSTFVTSRSWSLSFPHPR